MGFWGEKVVFCRFSRVHFVVDIVYFVTISWVRLLVFYFQGGMGANLTREVAVLGGAGRGWAAGIGVGAMARGGGLDVDPHTAIK